MKKLFTLFCLFLAFQSIAYGQKANIDSNPINLQDYSNTIDIKDFKIISTDPVTRKIKYSFALKGKYKNLDVVVTHSSYGSTITKNNINSEINNTNYQVIEFESDVDNYYTIVPYPHTGNYRLLLQSTYDNQTITSNTLYQYYPDDYNYPYSSEILVKDFEITSKTLSNSSIFYNFNIKGKYQTLTLQVYQGAVNDNNRICTSYWNSDKDDPIFYQEYQNYRGGHFVINKKYDNHVISGKYFLVVDYWYNGVKQTKTLEFYKEPAPEPAKKNDVKISNVKIRKVGTSFSQPPMYDSSKPTTPTIDWAQQYEVSVTVDNIGEEDINQQLSLLVKGYETTNPNSNLFIFTSNFPSIKKGSQIKDFPIIISQSGTSSKNSLEMLVQIDPSNTLNDKNLTDNKHTLKYNYRSSNGKASELESSLINNIDVYNSTGSKIKSTSVNDLEQGLQDIKKSLPKGHYYLNVDGKKSQVQIK